MVSECWGKNERLTHLLTQDKSGATVALKRPLEPASSGPDRYCSSPLPGPGFPLLLPQRLSVGACSWTSFRVDPCVSGAHCEHGCRCVHGHRPGHRSRAWDVHGHSLYHRPLARPQLQQCWEAKPRHKISPKAIPRSQMVLKGSQIALILRLHLS